MWAFQDFLRSRGDCALEKGHSGFDCRDPLCDLPVLCVSKAPLSSLGGGALALSFSLGVLLDFLKMPFLDPVNEGAGNIASYVVVFFLIKKKNNNKIHCCSLDLAVPKRPLC